MFPRLIIALIVVIAAIACMRHLRSRIAARGQPAVNAKTLRCAQCEVYFPRDEAVVRDGKTYCSAAHAELADR